MSLEQDKKLCVFSLGNPGEEYKLTRHNAGRIVCEELVRSGAFDNNNILYFEPTTFMNNTGKYIKENMRNRKDNSLVVIVYDDIDIDVGNVKLSFGRSSGGHNGVQSVIDELGTKDFYRVRVGIGGKTIKEMLLQDYVLSKLSQLEIKILKESSDKVLEKILEIKTKK